MMYFWTYALRKTWSYKCLKSPVSEDPSTSNMGKGPKHCWNLNDSTFTISTDPSECNSVGKPFFLIWKILGLFVNPLTSDGNYSVLSWGNLLQDFKMHLSQKRKTLCQLFFPFSKFTFNFEHFRKNDRPLGWNIFALTISEKRG